MLRVDKKRAFGFGIKLYPNNNNQRGLPWGKGMVFSLKFYPTHHDDVMAERALMKTENHNQKQ